MSDKVKDGLRQPTFCSEGAMSNPLWVYGIEPGLDPSMLAEEHRTLMTGRLERWPQGDGPFEWARTLKYRFGISFGWVYQAMCGREPRDSARDLTSQDASNLVYKSNLLPINFPNTDGKWWTDLEVEAWTSWPNKESYRADMMHTRYAEIRECLALHKPRVVLVSGLTMLDDAVMAFGRRDVKLEHSTDIGGITGLRCWRFTLCSEGTIVFVLPFFGTRSGINSHKKAAAIGAEIRRFTGDWT